MEGSLAEVVETMAEAAEMVKEVVEVEVNLEAQSAAEEEEE